MAQRTVYNVWGRMLYTREAANARADKALQDNPKITNLHIAIVPQEKGARTLVCYQARWYDRKVARKLASEKREFQSKPKHTCNCEYCPL